MLNLFSKKLEEKFGAKEKVLTFAVPSETHWFHEHGSLAQLVQSVCLTSRGSGVRLPQLPQKTPFYIVERRFFVLHPMNCAGLESDA